VAFIPRAHLHDQSLERFAKVFEQINIELGYFLISTTNAWDAGGSLLLWVRLLGFVGSRLPSLELP
jgi:hypothetical protein